MGHSDYGSAKKAVFRGMWLLAAVTLVEVFFSLAGKGYIPGITFIKDHNWTVFIVGFLLISFSLYKAYFIVYEFMHMGTEVQGLRMTVLLPMLLLVWAVIAFFNEGNAWKDRREVVNERNQVKTIEVPIGGTMDKKDTKKMK